MPFPPGASLDLNFATGLPVGMTFTRAAGTNSSATTDSFWTDASGSSYNTYAINVPRFTSTGMIFEAVAKANYLLNSATPATQTTSSLAVAAWVLWVIGTGSATVTAGTGVATGLGTATGGSPLYFTVTTAGTFVVTVNGSLNRFQLERGGASLVSPTSFVATGAAIGTRQAETCYQATDTWYNATAGTIVAAASWPLLGGATGTTGIFELSDGTATNTIRMTQNPNPVVQVVTSGTTVVNVGLSPATSPFVAGNISAIAQRYTSAGNARGAFNGLLMADQNGKAIPTVNRIGIYVGATGNQGCTWIMNRGLYYPWAFADYELQCATAGNSMAGAAVFM